MEEQLGAPLEPAVAGTSSRGLTRAALPPWPLWTLFFAIAFVVSGAIVGGLVFSVLAIAVGAVSGDHFGLKSPGVLLGSTLMQDLAMVAGSLLAVKLAAGRVRLSDFGFVPVVRRWAAAGLTLLVWVGFLLFTAGWAKLLGEQGHQSLTSELGTDRSPALWVGALLLVVIAAPLAEEFLFRGLILTVLWRRLGFVGAALITGTLFGLLHAGSSSVSLLVPLGVLGVLLCLLRKRTGSLIPCIAAHTLNNSVAYCSLEHVPAGWFLLIVISAQIVTVGIAVLISRRA